MCVIRPTFARHGRDIADEAVFATTAECAWRTHTETIRVTFSFIQRTLSGICNVQKHDRNMFAQLCNFLSYC